MLSKARAHYLLEEFTDFVLEDDIRGSIVVNVKEDYYNVVNYELKKLGYRLIHKSLINNTNTFTLVFTVIE